MITKFNLKMYKKLHILAVPVLTYSVLKLQETVIPSPAFPQPPFISLRVLFSWERVISWAGELNGNLNVK